MIFSQYINLSNTIKFTINVHKKNQDTFLRVSNAKDCIFLEEEKEKKHHTVKFSNTLSFLYNLDSEILT